MSRKLPRVKADCVARALERHGFIVVRQSGSHRIFRNATGIRVTLPMHAGAIVHPRILRAILADTGISPDDL